MAIKKFTIPAAGSRKAFTLYAEMANINYFLKTPLTPDQAAGVTVKRVTVKAHQRQQYPGDVNLSNVPSVSREVLVDPTRRSGNGLPGRTIVLVADAGFPLEERRQFTLKGNWLDFHAWLMSKAKFQINAYNHTGAMSVVEPLSP
jgi:hypothetical protein